MPTDDVPCPASELTVVEGFEPRPRREPEAEAAFAALPAAPSIHEARYELLAVNARGFHPPRFLRLATDTGGHLPGAGGPGSGPGGGPGSGRHGPVVGGPGGDDLRLAWSVEYRRIAETAPEGPAPFAVYLLGVDPPPEASEEELEAFDAFYTDVHLPEVAERRQARRAVRYELIRARRPPHVLPRYLALYEVDEQGAARRRHQGPPYARGPAVWQAHSTPWRLWYRFLAGYPNR